MAAIATRDPVTARRYAVHGMTCGACARHVQAALEQQPGVRVAHMDFASGVADVELDERPASFEAMRQAVADAGYTLDYAAGRAPDRYVPVRSILVGLVAAASLLGLYLGLITLAQSWGHAVEQLIQDRWFVGAIAAGFGTQVGLFAYLRMLHGRATAGGVAASTGTSTAAMLACCAHHLTDILPVIGLSGAAVFLNVYKTPLLWLGITMNALGIGYMLWQIRRQRAMVGALASGQSESPAVVLAAEPSSASCH